MGMKAGGKTLRMAVIGAGGMGSGFCRNVFERKTIKNVHLAAVVDTDVATARKIGRQCKVPWFPHHRALIGAGLCDAVYVATPHPEHGQPSMDCLKAGLHVLCEKPLTERISTAREMVRLAARKKLVLSVDFPLRCGALYAKAIDIARSGRLGALCRSLLVLPDYRTQAYYNSGSWRATWKGEGGGVLVNQAPHYFDFFLQLTGAPSEVFGLTSSRVHDIEVENTAQALLRYPEGGFGYVYASTFETHPGRMVEIVGEKGKMFIRDSHIEVYTYGGSLTELTRGAGGVWQAPEVEKVTIRIRKKKDPPTPFQNFVNCVLYGEPLMVTGESALASLELANAIALSSERGRWVKLPLNGRAYDTFLAGKRRTSRYVKRHVKEQRITDPGKRGKIVKRRAGK